MMRRKGLVILGYYGAGNFGDDLMLRGLLSELTKFESLDRVTIVSYYSGPVDLSAFGRGQIRLVRLRSTFAKLTGLVPLLIGSRMAVFGGGTPFTDVEGDGSYKFFRIARILGCRFAYLGVGIGKLNSPSRRRRASWLLQRAEAVIFREPVSRQRAFDLIEDAGSVTFSLGDDLCFLDDQLTRLATRRISPDRDSGRLLLSWRHLPKAETGIEPNVLVGKFVAAVRVLQKKRQFHTIQILPLDSTADAGSHQSLVQMVAEVARDADVLLMQGWSVESKLTHIRKAGLYLSVRLHGALVGKMLGVPTIGFNYSPKVEYMFSSIASTSLVQWDELIRNQDCLLAVADLAIEEASRRIDVQSRTSRARGAVDELMKLYTQ